MTRQPWWIDGPREGRWRNPVLITALAAVAVVALSILVWLQVRSSLVAEAQLNSKAMKGDIPNESNAAADLKRDQGQAVLKRLLSKLQSIQELDGRVESLHHAKWDRGGELRSGTFATVKMRRKNDSWRIRGNTTPVHPNDPGTGSPFELLSDRTGTRVSLLFVKGGVPQEYGDLIPALEALRGITLDTANILPDLILEIPFKEPLSDPSGKPMLQFLLDGATLDGEEMRDGRECYRISSRLDTGTWTLWIEKRQSLPIAVEMVADGDQIKSSGLGLAGTITHMKSTHHIEITHVR